MDVLAEDLGSILSTHVIIHNHLHAGLCIAHTRAHTHTQANTHAHTTDLKFLKHKVRSKISNNKTFGTL